MIIAYIDAYRASFGVESICRVLRDHAYQIAPSTYYAFKKRAPSKRSRSDVRLLEVIARVHRVNFACYGVRKMWHALRHEGETVGRDQVARLMRAAGLRGLRRQRKVRTTTADPVAARHPDLVQRAWNRSAPDRVWVSDFTHVSTAEGTVYVAFLQDAFSRRILGFTVRTSKSTVLVERALSQAVSTRERRSGQRLQAGVIAHSDAGSQYTSWDYGARLRDHGMHGSIGGVGTALDNALMESTIGLYKTEVIHRQSWRSRQQVESATTNWVAWFNRERLHSELGYRSPEAFERAYHQQQALPRQAA